MTKERTGDLIKVTIGAILILVSLWQIASTTTEASIKPDEAYKFECTQEEAKVFYGDNF